MNPLIPIYLEDPAEKYEIIIFTNSSNISSRITPLYLKPSVLLNYNHDIYLYYVLNVKSQEIIVLNKRIKKLDSRRIVRIRIINEIIKEKKIRYI